MAGLPNGVANVESATARSGQWLEMCLKFASKRGTLAYFRCPPLIYIALAPAPVGEASPPLRYNARIVLNRLGDVRELAAEAEEGLLA